MPSSQSLSHNDEYFQTLLESARPFLRGELETINENLPGLVSVLRSVGAGECWHKHGSFLDHLVDLYRILKIWKAPESVCLCGLFHSAYSNSYVNLAIFDPSTGRDTVRAHVGDAAERLIHLFCIVPRQSLIHDDLLFKYTDSELIEHLELSEISVKNAKEKNLFNDEEPWRLKLQSLVPAQGISVKHIKTGDDVLLSRRVFAVFLMMTMGDFSDQLFSFQDSLFENSNGRLEFSGNNISTLWPGDGKPGLWINSISRMGAIYTLILREEEIFIEQRRKKHGDELLKDRDEDIELVIPPVFEHCTRILDSKDQIIARELYWEAVCYNVSNKTELKRAEEMLLRSLEKNPFVGEPYVVLAQIYLSEGRFEEAEKMAEKGVRLLVEWGSPWDKRMSWEGWIAWSRVLLTKAKERSWPNTSWGILNLGLVSPSPTEDGQEPPPERLPSIAGGIVALGKFDTLHTGHQELAIQAATIGVPFLLAFVGMAEILGWEPRAPIVAKCDQKQVLSSWAPHCGNVIPREFEVEFSKVRYLTPQQFVEKLAKELRVHGVVAGQNYRFGYRAAGDASDLVQLCKEYGIGAYIINLVMDKNQDSADINSCNSKERGQVSSTRVRHALSIGDMKYVSELLGRHHRLMLMVKNKEKISSNRKRLSAPRSCLLNLPPKEGIYTNCSLLFRDKNVVPCRTIIDTTEIHLELNALAASTHFTFPDLELLGVDFGESVI